jgi:alpha-1,2-mannosyltransferase
MTGGTRPRSRAGKLFLPLGSVLLLALTTGLVLSVAGSTLGYDYRCYEGAAQALRDGRPMYDVAFSVNVGTCPGTYTYPPAFAVILIPWLSLGGAAPALWCGAMAVCFLAGAALLPVRRDVRWLIVILGAVDWPLLYAIKLGQVEPILFLLFSATWRWLDRPWAVGLATAAGALMKVQPALVGVWAAMTRRWRAAGIAAAVAAAGVAVSGLIAGFAAWTTYSELLRSLGSNLTTPHNFALGALAYRAGLPVDTAAAIQLGGALVTVGVVLWAWWRATPEASLLVTIVASQLVSSPLRDHYAVLLLLPAAWLLERNRGWAVAIPLLGWISLFDTETWLPAASVPLLMYACMAAVLWVASAERGPVLEPVPAG